MDQQILTKREDFWLAMRAGGGSGVQHAEMTAAFAEAKHRAQTAKSKGAYYVVHVVGSVRRKG